MLTEGGLETDPLAGDGSHLVGPVIPNVPGGIGHGAFIRDGFGGLIEPIERGLADDVGRGVDARHVEPNGVPQKHGAGRPMKVDRFRVGFDVGDGWCDIAIRPVLGVPQAQAIDVDRGVTAVNGLPGVPDALVAARPDMRPASSEGNVVKIDDRLEF